MRVIFVVLAFAAGCDVAFTGEGDTGGGGSAEGGDSNAGGGAAGAGGAGLGGNHSAGGGGLGGMTVGGGGSGGDKGDCPAPWVPGGNGNCYLQDGNHTWSDAANACVAAGGHLAALATASEIGVVESTLSLTPGGTYWLGGQRVSATEFGWITGELWTYVNGQDPWSSASEPNNDGGIEDCLELKAVDGLNDRPCSEMRPAVCEWVVGG